VHRRGEMCYLAQAECSRAGHTDSSSRAPAERRWIVALALFQETKETKEKMLESRHCAWLVERRQGLASRRHKDGEIGLIPTHYKSHANEDVLGVEEG